MYYRKSTNIFPFPFCTHFYNVRENWKKNSITAVQTKVVGEKNQPRGWQTSEYNGFSWFHKVQIQHWGMTNHDKKCSFPPSVLTYMKGKAVKGLGPFRLCCFSLTALPKSWFQHPLWSLAWPSYRLTDYNWCLDIQLSPAAQPQLTLPLQRRSAPCWSTPTKPSLLMPSALLKIQEFSTLMSKIPVCFLILVSHLPIS